MRSNSSKNTSSAQQSRESTGIYQIVQIIVHSSIMIVTVCSKSSRLVSLLLLRLSWSTSLAIKVQKSCDPDGMSLWGCCELSCVLNVFKWWKRATSELLGSSMTLWSSFLCCSADGKPQYGAAAQHWLNRAMIKGLQQLICALVLPDYPQEIESPLGLVAVGRVTPTVWDKRAMDK